MTLGHARFVRLARSCESHDGRKGVEKNLPFLLLAPGDLFAFNRDMAIESITVMKTPPTPPANAYLCMAVPFITNFEGRYESFMDLKFMRCSTKVSP